MLKDLRYAYRVLRHNPGFALTAIVSIALAIGANSAIFSFQDGILLRPLAVQNPSTLVTVNSRTPTGGLEGFPYPDFVELRDKNRSFEGLVAYRIIGTGFARDEKTQPQFRMGFLVTGNFFDLLGVKPYLGRAFRKDEDQVPGRDPVAVLSYDFWQNELGSDPAIVGRRIRIGRAGGLEFTVVGVAPESFTGMDLFIRPDFFLPSMMGPQVLGEKDETLTSHNARSREDSFYIKARLKPDVSIQAAAVDVEAIAKTLEQDYPDSNRGRSATVRTEIQSRLDAQPTMAGIVGVVFGLMIVILLIACANVMNLMLTHGRAQAREMAVRLSIGATRAKLIRQLMAESLLIAITGGLLGLLIAKRATEFFSTLELPGEVPVKFVFQLDTRVLLFTFIVSFISAILFGLLPAFRSTTGDLTSALKAGELTNVRKRFFGRHGLVAIQVAGSIVLIMAAAQMYRSTLRVLNENPGFVMDHRLTVRLDTAVAGYSLPQSEQFYRRLIERARDLPGVKSALVINYTPFTTDGLVTDVVPEGFEFAPGQHSIRLPGNIVDEHYFETFNVPILAGRGFLSSDNADSPPVAVVSKSFAQRFFGGNAIGKRVRIGQLNKTWMEIVGVSADAKYQTPVQPTTLFVYVPFSQNLRARMTLVVATSGDPSSMAPAVRDTIRSLDPNVPIFAVRTLDEIFQRGPAAQLWLFNVVFSSTGLMGFALALVGLYAVVAYQVTRRTREIGIRMALGAKRLQVMTGILKQAASVGGVGIIIGLTLSMVVRPVLLVSLGRPTSAFDPFTLVVVPLGLMLITLLAASVPARRAAQIDPQRALRQD